MSSSDSRTPAKSQVSRLPGLSAYIIGNNSETGQASLKQTRSIEWQSHDEDKVGMSVVYTTHFPAELKNDADIAAHDERMNAGKVGIPVEGGTMLGYLDVAPGHTCKMHRTQTVDYGIVLEGEITGVLDSGETIPMHRGDVMIQRATMHAWRNPSQTEWARMVLCLQQCKPEDDKASEGVSGE